MLRLRFEKTGNAIWISHLDLMRLFQRAFKRAGLPLTHSQGYNPRPSVSIALPLSVGVESKCELLDFELDGVACSCEEIAQRLNDALVSGVRVLEVYSDGRKLKELSLLKCRVTLVYDKGVPERAEEQLRQLFTQESVIVEKKGKNGITQQDIIPLIKSLKLYGEASEIKLDAVVCCQNPSLNPMQLSAAVEKYLPSMRPDYVKYGRVEIFDETGNVFK